MGFQLGFLLQVLMPTRFKEDTSVKTPFWIFIIWTIAVLPIQDANHWTFAESTASRRLVHRHWPVLQEHFVEVSKHKVSFLWIPEAGLATLGLHLATHSTIVGLRHGWGLTLWKQPHRHGGSTETFSWITSNLTHNQLDAFLLEKMLIMPQNSLIYSIWTQSSHFTPMSYAWAAFRPNPVVWQKLWPFIFNKVCPF